jgi:DNA-binding protein H-NS
MASLVYGAGASHTPMLNAAAEEWPLFEELDRQRSHPHKDRRRATPSKVRSFPCSTGNPKNRNETWAGRGNRPRWLGASALATRPTKHRATVRGVAAKVGHH